MVTIYIDINRHYQLIKIGDEPHQSVQVWDYGLGCGDSSDEKELIAAVPLEIGKETWVIWLTTYEVAGNILIRLYKSDIAIGEPYHGFGDVICGDDFIYSMEQIQNITTWKLWVDDQLDDPDQEWRHCPKGFFGATSVIEAVQLVEELGCPSFMDLDCDLGEGGRIQDFLKYLENEHSMTPPKWKVHSQNPVAAENVNSFMESWHRFLRAKEDHHAQ